VCWDFCCLVKTKPPLARPEEVPGRARPLSNDVFMVSSRWRFEMWIGTYMSFYYFVSTRVGAEAFHALLTRDFTGGAVSELFSTRLLGVCNRHGTSGCIQNLASKNACPAKCRGIN